VVPADAPNGDSVIADHEDPIALERNGMGLGSPR
jgi:hypothetical protein